MRSYAQYCALARTLDVVGDRWCLLVVRNLLLGPQRFGELVEGLPGIARNLLAARLAALVEAGVLEQRELGDDERTDGEGAPAVLGYALTPRGAELEPALFALADWGERHAFGQPHPGEAVRARYLLTSIRRRMRAMGKVRHLALVVDGARFAVRLGQRPTVVQGRIAGATAKARVVTDFAGLAALVVAREPLAKLAKSGRLTVEGDAQLVHAFVDAVPPP